jgi:hypothetical protein
MPATPGGTPQPFFSGGRAVFEPLLVAGGDSIVFRSQQGYNRDIYIAAVADPTGARALTSTPASDHGAAVSPDEKWLAYTSNFAGKAQVYVRRMGESNERWQVSAAAGGAEVRWGANGREVLYRRGDSVFAVGVTLGAEVVAGREQFLFSGRYQGLLETRYDVTRDGSRFVMVRLEGPGRGTRLHVVMNWFSNARRR